MNNGMQDYEYPYLSSEAEDMEMETQHSSRTGNYDDGTTLDISELLKRDMRACGSRVLSREEETKLFTILRDYPEDSLEYKKAMEELTVCNIALIYRIVEQNFKKCSTTTMSFMDMVSEGYFGLRKAILNFDVTRGNRLSTYATMPIKQSINRALAQRGGNRKMSENEYNNTRRIMAIFNKYKAAGESERDAAVETAKEMKRPLKDIMDTVRLSQPAVSLNSTMYDFDPSCSDNAESAMVSKLADTHISVEDDAINKDSVERIIKAAKEILNPTAYEIFYALNIAEEKPTQGELGAKFGMPQSKVCHLNRSVRKLLNYYLTNGKMPPRRPTVPCRKSA